MYMPQQTVNRREWLAATAAAGAIVATGAGLPAQAQAKRVPGVQLYTLRDAMATDVEKTLQAVAGIGYREVEFAGYFMRTPAQIRDALARFDLTSPSTHVDGETIQSDPRPFVDVAAEIGHDYVTLAYIQPENRTSADDWKRWVEVANRFGEACRSTGLRAAYHNHDFEFRAIDGIVPFELLLAETELLDFEIDFYWVRDAGLDVRDVLAMAPERMVLSHIKDRHSDGRMVDVGDGTIDFAAILADPVAASIRHCFVEHDAPEDPFRTVAASHQVLKQILL